MIIADKKTIARMKGFVRELWEASINPDAYDIQDLIQDFQSDIMEELKEVEKDADKRSKSHE